MLKGRSSAKTPTTIFLERVRTQSPNTASLLTLTQAFKYFDIVSALASRRSPLGESFVLPSQPAHLMQPIDPLFGLLEPLWPILHRLAMLVETKRSIAANSHRRESILRMQSDLDEDSRNIELFLVHWQPKLPRSCQGEDPSQASEMQLVLGHAEAWRQAALVHLRTAILNLPRSNTKIQEPVKQIYENCLRVMIVSGPCKGLLWPLFVAASQTEESTDKEYARSCFRQLAKGRSMNNITVAWEKAEELWKRQSGTSTNQVLGTEVLDEIIAD